MQFTCILPCCLLVIDALLKDKFSFFNLIGHPGGLDCSSVAVYPNWVRKDWSGGAYTHNKAGDEMTYSGSLYVANWYTRSLPGSDQSWTYVGACN